MGTRTNAAPEATERCDLFESDRQLDLRSARLEAQTLPRQHLSDRSQPLYSRMRDWRIRELLVPIAEMAGMRLVPCPRLFDLGSCGIHTF
jgi:hypothetical protein